MRDSLTIGELSARSGVPTSALRFYESRGLIRAGRTGGNQRRYDRAELRRVAFIRIAQRVGLTLDEIAQALATLPGFAYADQGRLGAAVGGAGEPASTSRSRCWSACANGSPAASAAAACPCSAAASPTPTTNSRPSAPAPSTSSTTSPFKIVEA